MPLPLSDNSSKSSRMSFKDKNKIVLDDYQLAKTFNNFYVGNLSVKSVTETTRYRDHPSI